jgi:26S proteasome regulatory subunit N6
VSDDESEEEVKQRENAIYGLAKMYMNKEQISDLVKLTKDIRPVFVNFPKAKTAKVVRGQERCY